MIDALDGQHSGVVANAFVNVVPLSPNQRRTAGITPNVLSALWSSVTITRTFGAEGAGTPRLTSFGGPPHAATTAHAKATPTPVRTRRDRTFPIRRAIAPG